MAVAVWRFWRITTRSALLEAVHVGNLSLRTYGTTVSEEVISQSCEMATALQGARILHLSATPYGGGVAEILRSEVPLLRDQGLAADWKIITGDKDFFTVTKIINALVSWLLRNPEEGKRIAEMGRELVRERFLLTRLIADELNLYASLVAGEPRRERRHPGAGESAAEA